MGTVQSCILLNYVSVISCKFINKFAQKCQYFTLMDQSVPLIIVTSFVYLGEKSALEQLESQLKQIIGTQKPTGTVLEIYV